MAPCKLLPTNWGINQYNKLGQMALFQIKCALHCKYFIDLHKAYTIVFTIISAITPAEFDLSITMIGLFANVIVTRLKAQWNPTSQGNPDLFKPLVMSGRSVTIWNRSGIKHITRKLKTKIVHQKPYQNWVWELYLAGSDDCFSLSSPSVRQLQGKQGCWPVWSTGPHGTVLILEMAWTSEQTMVCLELRCSLGGTFQYEYIAGIMLSIVKNSQSQTFSREISLLLATYFYQFLLCSWTQMNEFELEF